MPTIPYKNKEGKRVPGVTTVNANLGWNSRPLIISANKLGQEGKTLDEWGGEAGAGTLTHAFIERYTLECLQEEPSDRYQKVVFEIAKLADELTSEQIGKAHKGFENYKKWGEQIELLPIVAEPHLVSELLRVGATPDLIAASSNGIVLVDYKTAKDLVVYSENLIQVSTYRKVWDELYPDKLITEILILKLDKLHGSFAHFEYEANHPKMLAAFEVFKYLRAIHDLKKEVK